MKRWSVLLLIFLCLFCEMGASLLRENGSVHIVHARGAGISYESPIKGIIQSDCGRCHSGPTRNLMDYDSLKAYVDGGLLETMVRGPMRRFAGNDAQTIIQWINNGAPEKPQGAAPARFSPKPSVSAPPCPAPGAGGAMEQPGTEITYKGVISRILSKDCLRCHSGPFRDLTTYRNVKMYVDNGLLKTLVMPGGPMHRFAGSDTRFFIAWVDSGAPQ